MCGGSKTEESAIEQFETMDRSNMLLEVMTLRQKLFSRASRYVLVTTVELYPQAHWRDYSNHHNDHDHDHNRSNNNNDDNNNNNNNHDDDDDHDSSTTSTTSNMADW